MAIVHLPKQVGKFIQDKVLLNWHYKLAALASAFVVWAYVAGQQSMQAVYTVPVYFYNFPADVVMANQSTHQVNVTISGRRDRILSLKERQIWVSIDLSDKRIGRNRYRIKKEDIVVPGGIEVKTYAPRNIIIRLEQERKEPQDESVGISR